MKKIFSLRLKVILSTGLLSILVISLAMGLSFFIDYNNDKKTANNWFNKAINEAYNITIKKNNYGVFEYYDMISYYSNKVDTVYSDHKDQLDSYDEDQLENYYKEVQNSINAPLFGGDLPTRRSDYFLILSTIVKSYNCNEITLNYYDADYNRVIIVDSVFSLGGFSGHFYQPTEEEKVYYSSGYKNQSYLITGDDVDKDSSQVIFFEDDSISLTLFLKVKTTIPSFQDTMKESNFLTYFFVTIGSVILLTIICIILSQLFIINNIKKLENATGAFIEKLDNNEQLIFVESRITSKDEIGVLANQFDLMQQSIIKYVDEIKENAAKEGYMSSELSIARNIQLNSLPESNYEIGDLRFESFIKPAKEVSGDFYDYFMINDNQVAFLIADVSGKGIPASLFMMRAKTTIKSVLMNNNNLQDAIRIINKELIYRNDLLLFVTVFIGVIDIKTKEIEYINCGHEIPFIINNGQSKTLNTESNIPLGLEEYDFIVQKYKLGKDEHLLLYTDGLPESINKDNEQFGLTRIQESISKHQNSNDLLNDIFTDMNTFANEIEQFDDVTMMVISLKSSNLHLEYLNPNFEVISEIIDKTEELLKGNNKSSNAGVVIDEVINNIISYGLKDIEETKLIVDCDINKDEIVLTIKDNGKRFNPLEVKDQKINENAIGGVGISLMRSMSKSQKYQYRDGMNILVIKI